MTPETVTAETIPVQVFWGQKVSQELRKPSLGSAYSKGFSMPAPLPYVSPHVPPPNAANHQPKSTPKTPEAASPKPLKKMTLVWLALGLITLSGTFFGAGIAFYRWKETAHQMAAHPTLAPPLTGAAPVPNLIKSLLPGTPAAAAPSSPKPASNDPKAQSSPKAPKDAQNQNYGVELGVFFAQENAVDLMDKLNVRQIQTVVKPQKNRAGVTVFSVQSADEFPSQRAAEVAARVLSSQNHLSAVAILLPAEAQAQPSGEQK